MSKNRPWAVFLGGSWILLNLIAAFLYAGFLEPPSGARVFGYSPGLTFFSIVLWSWPSYAVGILLIHFGNGIEPVGHWYQLLERVAVEPSAVYRGTIERLSAKETPGVSTRHFLQMQRGLVSGQRRYLRIKSGYFVFEMCAMPFGKDFGVSWRCFGRMGLTERTLISIPILGWIAYFLLFRYTAYMEDRGLLFQTATHSCVRDTVDAVLSEHGLPALGEAQRQPVISDMFKRWK